MGQYSGFLHAGLIAYLIDTACGLASGKNGAKVSHRLTLDQELTESQARENLFNIN